jgi:hypothetical protein
MIKLYREDIGPSEFLISFVNHHFGILRNLSFIVVGEDPEKVKRYLQRQPFVTIDKIWEKTLLSSRAIEFPLQLAKQMGQTPPIVKSLEEGENAIMEMVEEGYYSGDPFYFRSEKF